MNVKKKRERRNVKDYQLEQKKKKIKNINDSSPKSTTTFEARKNPSVEKPGLMYIHIAAPCFIPCAAFSRAASMSSESPQATIVPSSFTAAKA